MLVSSHMAWGLVFGLIASKAVGRNPRRAYLLIAGALPDLDLISHAAIMRIYGTDPYGTPFGHHGLAHTWFGISILFLGFALFMGKGVIPYYVASLQHILFGDLVTNKVPLFFPLSLQEEGLMLYLHPVSVGLEVLGFVILVYLAAYQHKGAGEYWSPLAILTIPLLGLTVRDALTYLNSSGLLYVYAVYGLISALSVLTIQFLPLLRKQRSKTSSKTVA